MKSRCSIIMDLAKHETIGDLGKVVAFDCPPEGDLFFFLEKMGRINLEFVCSLSVSRSLVSATSFYYIKLCVYDLI